MIDIHKNKITEAELALHRKFLYRYALLHLRDSDLAEDAVQDTLLSAFMAAQGYEGRASVRTWLVSILKNKIIDIMRKEARMPIPESQLAPEEGNSDIDEPFTAAARWERDRRPRTWEDPDEALERKQFWEMFELCCKVMPLQTARVFMLREVMGLSIEEICKNMEISTSNCSVILYRARMRLRDCIEVKWFGNRRKEK